MMMMMMMIRLFVQPLHYSCGWLVSAGFSGQLFCFRCASLQKVVRIDQNGEMQPREHDHEYKDVLKYAISQNIVEKGRNRAEL